MKSILRDYASLYSYPVSGTLIYCTEEVNNLYSNVYLVVDHLIELTEIAHRNLENGSVYQVSIDIINTYINATLKSSACRDILDRMIFRYPILLLEANQEFSHRKYDYFKSVFLNTYQSMHHLKEIVHDSIFAMNTTIKLFIDITNEYVESMQHSLTDVYTVLSTESIHSAISLLKDFSFEVDTKEQTLFEYMTNWIIIARNWSN